MKSFPIHQWGSVSWDLPKSIAKALQILGGFRSNEERCTQGWVNRWQVISADAWRWQLQTNKSCRSSTVKFISCLGVSHRISFYFCQGVSHYLLNTPVSLLMYKNSKSFCNHQICVSVCVSQYSSCFISIIVLHKKNNHRKTLLLHCHSYCPSVYQGCCWITPCRSWHLPRLICHSGTKKTQNKSRADKKTQRSPRNP